MTDFHNGRPINRVPSALPVQAMKTFSIRAPLATHHRRVSCAEAECPTYVDGWRSIIDESTDLGKEQALYIRVSSGRSFVESRDETGLTIFDFEPGQRDFRPDDEHEHFRALERDPLLTVRGGDWRGATSEPRVHTNADDWVDEFANNQIKLADRAAQG